MRDIKKRERQLARKMKQARMLVPEEATPVLNRVADRPELPTYSKLIVLCKDGRYVITGSPMEESISIDATDIVAWAEVQYA